jgi:hypothetical protein
LAVEVLGRIATQAGSRFEECSKERLLAVVVEEVCRGPEEPHASRALGGTVCDQVNRVGEDLPVPLDDSGRAASLASLDTARPTPQFM